MNRAIGFSSLLALAVLLPAAAQAADSTALTQLQELSCDEAKEAASGAAGLIQSVAARRGDHGWRDDGREEAAQACRQADFDSDKNKCLAIVGQARSFNARAARLCGRMSFSSSVPKCMSAVADKDYVDSIVDGCGENSFDNRIIECLQSSGRSYEPYPRPSPPYPPYPPHPRPERECRGYDRGWEEHWGGHGGRGYNPAQACQECRNRHGSCVFRCTQESYRCTAEWRGENGASRDYQGRTRPSRYEAEEEAVRACRDANWHNPERGDCWLRTCDEVQDIVESGRCG